MKRTGSTSLTLNKLIIDLNKLGRKENVKLWKRLSEDLSRSTRQRREVNIHTISRHTKEGEIAVIPGKVLSKGELNKKLTVAAYKFSEESKNKINKVGKAISIKQLMQENPKGKNVRILG